MRIVRRLLVVALLGAILVGGWQFAASNGDPITIDLLAIQFVDVKLWIVLLAAFGLGASLVAVLALYQRARLGLVARRYRKAVHSLESEVHQLRNLPLTGEAPGADVDTAPAPGAHERGS